jgi:hypothetical protein
MNHQYFENLLLEDRALTPEEKEKLGKHLSICTKCTDFEQSLRALDHEFKLTSVASPSAGFTARWQANLPDRRKQHEAEQKRIISISMGATIVATGITLAVFLLPKVSPITVLANLFADFVSLVDLVTNFWSFIGSFFNAIPTSFSIGILATISIWLTITLLAWGITLYRITLKGIRTAK